MAEPAVKDVPAVGGRGPRRRSRWRTAGRVLRVIEVLMVVVGVVVTLVLGAQVTNIIQNTIIQLGPAPVQTVPGPTVTVTATAAVPEPGGESGATPGSGLSLKLADLDAETSTWGFRRGEVRVDGTVYTDAVRSFHSLCATGARKVAIWSEFGQVARLTANGTIADGSATGGAAKLWVYDNDTGKQLGGPFTLVHEQLTAIEVGLDGVDTLRIVGELSGSVEGCDDVIVALLDAKLERG